MKLLNIFFALILTSFLAKGQCPNDLDMTMTNNAVLSCANPSVQLAVSPEGGVPPYNYLWANGIAQSTFSVSIPGTYCVTVTDIAGCTITGCAIVTQDITIPLVNISGPTTITCGNGPFTLFASTNAPNSTYSWTGPNGYTSTTNSPIITNPGTYTLVVTNSNGCTSTATWTVAGSGLDISAQHISCFGANDGSAAVNIPPNSPPASSFSWTSPTIFFQGNTQTISNLQAAQYSVVVTFNNGSTCSATTTITEPAPLSLGVPNSVSGCDQVQVVGTATGGTPPYNFIWSNGATGTAPIFTQPGTYFVTVVDANGCNFSKNILVDIISGGCDIISGKITQDTSQNCLAEPGEPGLANWIVRADKTAGGTFFGLSDSTGHYEISVFPGEYFVAAVSPSPFYDLCPPLSWDQWVLTFVDPGDTLPADFVVKSPVLCPDLSVQLSSGLLRRCLSNNYYYVNYCNFGSADATGATLEIALDPNMSPLVSSFPYSVLANNHLLFQLGNLTTGACGNISLQVQISCDAVLGQTLCSEAKIAATNDCPPDPTAQLLAISHECAADSLRFFIENNGGSAITAGYVVIEDAVMFTAPGGNSAVIQPGGQMQVSLPKNGETWRVEANVLGAPIIAWRSVEGCGTNPTGSFSTGYVNLFPQDPTVLTVDMDCGTVVGSFDPNDKAARPAGFGSEHFIKNGTEIEYKIRFQNTGTDTAFNVAIRDTLDASLDPATFRAGASSHAFSTELLGEGVIVFHFKNILLPDSFVNEPASNGFVEFAIKTKDRPDGTVIKNDAAIFFDFNDPVITNEVFHTIGENFVPTATFFLPAEQAKLTAAPNPFFEKTVIEFAEKIADSPMVLRVFDVYSKEIRREKVSSNRFVFERKDLPGGFYFLLLEKENGQGVGSGKLIVR